MKCPLVVKFPIPDPRDRFSLKPGSVAVHFPKSKGSEVHTSSSLDAAIAGARAAATQFSKKDQNQTSQTEQTSTPGPVRTTQTMGESIEENGKLASEFGEGVSLNASTSEREEKRSRNVDVETSGDARPPCPDSRPRSDAPSKVHSC